MSDSKIASVAQINTERASGYLQQLCKHFAHRVPSSFDAQQGQVVFEMGVCDMTAQNGVLQLNVTSPDADGLERTKDVIARHLVRFAFREDLAIQWQDRDAA